MKSQNNDKGVAGILKSIESKLQQNPVRSIFNTNNTRSGIFDNMIINKNEVGFKTLRKKAYESVDWESIRKSSVSKSKNQNNFISNLNQYNY